MSLKTKRTVWKKRIIAVCMVLMLVFGTIPNPLMRHKEESLPNAEEVGRVTFGNNGYPYGQSFSDSTVTLAVSVASGEVTSYQWEKSTEKNGTYTPIEGATQETYTENSPENRTWYRCKINGNQANITKPVMLLKSGADTYEFLRQQFSNYWYISNGTMAYTLKSPNMFDVVGLYSKTDTTYWMNTSFSDGWQMYSSSSAEPSAVKHNSAAAAKIKSVMIGFKDNDIHAVVLDVQLEDGENAFSVGCDTMLGTSTITSYADNASLGADIVNEDLVQVRMAGASSIDEAQDTDPAFVLRAISGYPISKFWLGGYYDRYAYSNNTSDTDADKYVTGNFGGETVVTDVHGLDSGMTASWLNLTDGRIQFEFSVGSVLDTGARISVETEPETDGFVVDEDTSGYYLRLEKVNDDGTTTVIKLVKQEDGTYKAADGGEGSEWVEGAVKFIVKGLESDTNYKLSVLTEADYSRLKNGGNVTPSVQDVQTAVDPLHPQTEDGVTTQIKVERTDDTIAISNIATNSDYAYALTDEEGNIVTEYQPQTDGKIVFTGLDTDTTYYIIAKHDGNDRSGMVALPVVTLKQAFVYNGTEQTVAGKLSVRNGENELVLGRDYEFTEDSTVSETKTGNYHIKVEFIGEYEGSGSVEKTWSIAKKAVTLKAKDQRVIYGDNIREDVSMADVTGIVEGEELAAIKLTQSTSELTDNGRITPSEALIVRGGENRTENYEITWQEGNLVIYLAEITGITENPVNVTYDGKPHSASVSVENPEDATVTYSKSEAGEYSEDLIWYTNACNDTVYYKIERKGYVTQKGTLAVNISKASLEIRANDNTIVYGEQPANAGVTYKGFVGNENADTEGIFEGELGYEINYEQYDDVGTYDIIVKGVESHNYEISYAAGTLTVNKRQLTKDMVYSNSEELVYTGTAHEPKVVVVDKMGDGKDIIEYSDYTVSYSNNINAGKGTFKVDATEKGNYYGSVEKSFTIGKAELLVKADNKSKIYGESDPKLTFTAEGFVGEDTAKTALTGEPVREKGEDVKEDGYTIGRGTIASANYDIVFTDGIFVIDKADNTAKPDAPVVVDRTWYSIELEPQVGCEFSIDGGETWQDNTLFDKLEKDTQYSFVARFKETNNYHSSVVSDETVGKTYPKENGDETKDVETIGTAPDTFLDNTVEELVNALLDEPEKQKVSDGADARIYVTVEDISERVSDEDKEKILEKVSEVLDKTGTVGMYLDINLFKKVGDADSVQISNTSGNMIKLSMKLPESLINTDDTIIRSYNIIGLHDGEVIILPLEYDSETNEVSFETDKFSIYSICYEDRKIETPTKETTAEDTTKNMTKEDTTTGATAPEKTSTEQITTTQPATTTVKSDEKRPETGDNNSFSVMFALMLLSVVSMLLAAFGKSLTSQK